MILPLIYYICVLLCCLQIYTCLYYLLGYGDYICYYYDEYDISESKNVPWWAIIGVFYIIAAVASFSLSLASTKTKKFTVLDNLIDRFALVFSVLMALLVSIVLLRLYTKDGIVCTFDVDVSLMNTMGISVGVLLFFVLGEIYVILGLWDESKKNKSIKEPLLPNHN